MSNITRLGDLDALVSHLRDKLEDPLRYILIFAHNGTGKTRLSMAFKEAGKVDGVSDTLYFNAFTEDLFSWDNDLENDTQRTLKLNRDSRFFEGLKELEMENRIRPLLQRYADFDFFIDYDAWQVTFIREDFSVQPSQIREHIKVSRGEENIFIWCFFLAVAELAFDATETEGAEVPYSWVQYIYIDDPISSLDDNHAVAVACHLAQLLKSGTRKIKAVISTHHSLFFNVIWNELNEKRKKFQPYYLSADPENHGYTLRYNKDTPFFHHVALLQQLHQAAADDQLYTFHFNILRNIMEKTAAFHGLKKFSDCINPEPDDPDGIIYTRLINILSHGNYSLYEPTEMLPQNKRYFKQILTGFMQNFRFDADLFPTLETDSDEASQS